MITVFIACGVIAVLAIVALGLWWATDPKTMTVDDLKKLYKAVYSPTQRREHQQK